MGAGLTEHIPASAEGLAVSTRRADVARNVTRLCTWDAWTTEARTCMHAAKTDVDLQACRLHLTAAQQARLTEAIGATFDVSGARVRAGELLGEMERLTNGMCDCTDLGCTYDVEHQVRDAVKRYPDVDLDDAEHARLATMDTRYAACMKKASELKLSWAPPRAELPEVPDDKSLPAECQAYRELIIHLGDCTKLESGIRAWLLESYTEMAAGWKDTPPDERPALAAKCKTAVAALERHNPCLAEKPPAK